MTGIYLSYWQFWLLLALALWAFIERLLLPSIRWFFRRKLNRLIETVNLKLDIEIRPFQRTKRKILIDRLVFDAEVMLAVDEYAKQKDMPREVVMKKIKRYANEIVPAFNAYMYYRLGYWLAEKLARWFYRVKVNIVDKHQLAKINSNATVVFVMNHRSNMDYILVSFLASRRTTLSYAVGEWAKIWPLQSLLRSMGAFFVRRNSRNKLYRKVLERYITMATREGVCQAMFPEGGLSKDGKLKPPKLGLLNYMLKNFNYQTDRDIVFIPVGINYDRTLEDRTLLRALDPDSGRKSAWFALKKTVTFWAKNFRLMWQNKWKNFGFAAVNFGLPLSAKAYSIENEVIFKTLSADERFVQIEAFSKGLFSAVENVIPMLPMSLICRIFLEHGEKAMTALEVKGLAFEKLKQCREKGVPDLLKSGAWDDAIQVTMEMLLLRHLLIEKQKLITIVPENINVIEYYANACHFYFEKK